MRLLKRLGLWVMDVIICLSVATSAQSLLPASPSNLMQISIAMVATIFVLLFLKKRHLMEG